MPRACGDLTHRHSGAFPAGLIHAETEPCPFADEGFVTGMFATCCSLRGKAAAYELAALGETELSDAMYSNMTCEAALEFALRLRACADRLQRTYVHPTDKPHGADWGGCRRNPTTGALEEYHDYTTFEDALARIREAARWYEKIGLLGFGVDAWY